MKNALCFSLLFLLFNTTIYGQTRQQDSTLAYQYLNQVGKFKIDQDSFRFYLEKSMPLLEKIEDWEIYIACLNALSNHYYKIEDYDSFDENTSKAIQVSEEKLKTPSNSTAEALNNKAFFYKINSNYDQAISIYKKSLSIQKQVSPSATSFNRLYQNISAAYRKKGDYDQAIVYLDQAGQILKDSLPKIHKLVAKNHLDIGHLFRDKALLEKAKEQYFNSLKILQALDSDKNPSVIDYSIFTHQSLAKVYLSQNNIDESLIQIQKAISLHNDRYQSRRITSYLILGDILMAKKDFPAALEAYQRSNEIAIQSYAQFDKKDTKARPLQNMAKAYFEMGDLNQARQYYQSALIALSIDFDETDPWKNPLIEQILSKIDSLKIIKGKAKTFLKKYESSQDLSDLKLAHDNFIFATKIIQALRNDFLSKGSKNILAEQSLDIYEGGIKTAFLLFKNTGDQKYKQTAFQFAEQNKARLLEESLQDNYAKMAGGLPEHELSMEQKLSNEITFYKNRINKAKRKSASIDRKKIKSWNKDLFETENKYNELIARFEKEYPDYHALKYAVKNTAIQDLKTKVLTDHNALIEYFVGVENIYLFCITQQEVQVFEIAKSSDFEASISAIRSIINQPSFDGMEAFKKDRNQFTQGAHQLYQTYLNPAISTLPDNINKLIIVPDDVLTYLPFELLLTEAAKKGGDDYSTNSCSYLFERFAISYNYSANLLMNHSAWKNKADLVPFIGFAPTFGKEIASTSRACTGDEVYTLQCNTKEVNSIFDLLGGEVITATKADVNAFKTQAQQSRILHLATHACVDEDNPDLNKIYFADHYITGADLNNLKLNAALAVLSACNTGSGKLIKGEGVMSLSRGFILSGCPSTLTSLWSVDDCTTSAIMLQYYKNLKKGFSKDEALQQAKLDHLSKADRVSSHPYYWAAFVQSGNVHPIDFSETGFNYWWYLILLPVFFLFFYFKLK